MTGHVPDGALRPRTVLLLALLVLIATQTPFIVMFNNPALDGGLYGPDSYMRAHRVLHLWQTGNWYDAWDTRTNAPYGEQLHWTRLLDGILIAGAWVGSAVTDFRTALRLWASVVSPLLLVATVCTLYWGTRRLIGAGAFLFMVALIPLLPVFSGTFLLARPDHHGLQAFLFVVQLMLFVRIAEGETRARFAVGAGIAAGTALWVSLEAFVPAAFFAAWLAVLWLWRGGAGRAHRIGLYCTGMLAAVCIALPLERPWAELWTAHFERLSVVHLVLVLAAAASWVVIDRAGRRFGLARSRARRLAAAVAGAAVPLAVMAVLFPKFFGGPFVDYDAAAFYPWLANISEYQTILPLSRKLAVSFLIHVGPSLVALVYIAWRWRPAPEAERDMLALFGLGLLCFLPLAVDALRWASYSQALTLVPWVLAARAAILSDPRLVVGGRRVKLRPLVVLLVAVGHLFAAAVVTPDELTKAIRKPKCDFPAIANYLDRTHRGGADDDVLLTYLFVGPQMVWRTPYSVIGAPYGNGAALRDTRAVFTATDDAAARALIEARGIDLIMICRNDRENVLYRDDPRRTLFSRLEDGTAPGWLFRVPLPADVPAEFALFRVDRGADGRIRNDERRPQ